MDELQQKMQHLIDRQEIIDCLHRYSRGLDRHDDELLRSVFHDDALDNHGSWVGRRDEFVQWANHECHERESAHMHHITTHNCEIDGRTAHAESYAIWVHRVEGETTVRVGGGRYIDRLEKRDGEWRIVVRRLFVDYGYTCDGEEPGASSGGGFPYPSGTQDRSDISYQRPLTMPEELMLGRPT